MLVLAGWLRQIGELYTITTMAHVNRGLWEKAGLVEGFLGLPGKVASSGKPVRKSRWPYEQNRRIENFNKVINGPLYPGKTSPRIERLICRSSLDGSLFSAGRAKKILSKLAIEKTALFGGRKPPVETGLISRILSFPGKYPKATLFLSGAGLGYWLGRKQENGSRLYPAQPGTNQQYGYEI